MTWPTGAYGGAGRGVALGGLLPGGVGPGGVGPGGVGPGGVGLGGFRGKQTEISSFSPNSQIHFFYSLCLGQFCVLCILLPVLVFSHCCEMPLSHSHTCH